MAGEIGGAMDIIVLPVLPMALKAAVELNVFEILAKAGPGTNLSSSQIVSQLPASNPNAAATLDRILRQLASYSILSCTIGPDGQRLYGLTPLCKDLLPDKDGISLAPLLLMTLDKVHLDCFHFLKDAVLDGHVPFNLTHGMTSTDYYGKDPTFSTVFSEALSNYTVYGMREILEYYRGFEGLKEIVDVGGGIGASLNLIISKYPHIKGINFDRPQVIQNAPPITGVTHVAGDMLESVPAGDAIFLKWILHDWDDEHSLRILKNCWKALPDTGKVIIADYILPATPTGDQTSRYVGRAFLMMHAINGSGAERTLVDLKALANEAGFPTIKAFPCSQGLTIIEAFKNPQKE